MNTATIIIHVMAIVRIVKAGRNQITCTACFVVKFASFAIIAG
jgi:hypothetical protein